MDKYKKIRKWNKVKENEIHDIDDESFTFKFLSFNILAQELLDNHMFLYKNHDKESLKWENRKRLLFKEILESRAHVISLQEVQKEHLTELLVPLIRNGYSYIFKKKTHEKVDGLLLLYKKDFFNLIDYSKVEFYQSDIRLLDRDNVGLVAKFSVKQNPKMQFIVATTHLLFNPRRSDIRLAQVQLLFSEIERLAFVKYTHRGPEYLPIILSGDFNFEPSNSVYSFIMRGLIEFVGKDNNLQPSDHRCLSHCLLPPRLYITDNCQHYDILLQRLLGRKNGKVRLEHSEYQYSAPGETDNLFSNSRERSIVNVHTKACQTIEVVRGHYTTFSSGYLVHPFKFSSVYKHVNEEMDKEATTYHDNWITTDYIFYSQMKLLEKYRLPSANNCAKYFPTIPNSVVGSDHFCLGATFLLEKI